jgi:hypothetical protein
MLGAAERTLTTAFLIVIQPASAITSDSVTS